MKKNIAMTLILMFGLIFSVGLMAQGSKERAYDINKKDMRGIGTDKDKIIINKKNIGDIKEIYIEPIDKTKILAKNKKNKIIEILNTNELPKESINPKGFELINKPFRNVALSPDKKMVAFACGMGNEWSGIYYPETGEIRQLTFFGDSNSGKLIWDSQGKRILEFFTDMSGYDMIHITEIATMKRIYFSPVKIITKKTNKNINIKSKIDKNSETIIQEYPEIKNIQWCDDDKNVTFELIIIRTEGRGNVKKKIIETMGKWKIDLSNLSVEKITNEK
jgi:hypothetical protein